MIEKLKPYKVVDPERGIYESLTPGEMKLNELIDAYNDHTHEIRESMGGNMVKTTSTSTPTNTTKTEKK